MNNNPRILLPLVAVVIVYLLYSIFRQRKQAETINARKKALVPGAKIMLTSGIYGTVLRKDADSVYVEIAPGVVTEWNPLAVAKIISTEETVISVTAEDSLDSVDSLPAEEVTTVHDGSSERTTPVEG